MSLKKRGPRTVPREMPEVTLKTGRIFIRNLNALIAVQQKFLNPTQTNDSDAIIIRPD